MQEELDTDTAGITWALTAWLISAAVTTPLLGRVGDLVGKRRTILIALSAVALGSVVAALAPSLPVLLAGRVLQGLGGAVFPLGFGIVRDVFPADRVAPRIGALSAVMAIGSGLGTVLAGPLSTFLSWRGLFLLPLVGVTVGGLLVFTVRDSAQRAPGRVNISAAILLSGWLVALLLPLSTGTQWGWSSPVVLGLFALAAALFVAWFVVEVRSREPLVDMRMMRLPGVWNTNLAAILLGAAMFGVFAYLARFVQTPASTGYGFGATVAESGLLMLPMLVTMAVVGFFTGPITRVIAFRGQLALGAALIALSSASIGILHQAPWQTAVAAGVFGLGLGMSFAAMTSIVVQSVPASQTGIASGMNANLRTIGGAIGTAVMTAIITSSLTAADLPAEWGYNAGFLVMAGLAAVAVVVALLSGVRPQRTAAPEPVIESPMLAIEAEAA